MRMAIVGRNPGSGGSEGVVFGHIGRLSHAFHPAPRRVGEPSGGELAAQGEWAVRPMRPGAGLETAPALVCESDHGADYCRSTGRIVMLSHSWSGKLQINDVGRRYTVDLYSAQTRLVLVDAINEIMVEVTPLARLEEGTLSLPRLSPEALVERIAAQGLWFRFLDPDAEFEPGPVRRALEAFRPRPGRAMRLTLMAALLPKLNAAVPAAPPPPAGPPAETARLADEVRMLAAAVEGLALSAHA